MVIGLSFSNMIFKVYTSSSLIHPSDIKVLRPKMAGNGFSSIEFSKIFQGSMPPDPPRNDSLKPVICVLRTHNRLLFRKLWLLKTLKRTLLKVYKSHTNASKLCVIMHHHSVCFYNGCKRLVFFFTTCQMDRILQTLQLDSFWEQA